MTTKTRDLLQARQMQAAHLDELEDAVEFEHNALTFMDWEKFESDHKNAERLDDLCGVRSLLSVLRRLLYD